MLGFNSDRLQLKQKPSEDQQQQLTGNSWPVTVVARLLAGLAIDRKHFAARNITEDLWQIWRALEDRVQLKSSSWCKQGVGLDGLHLRARVSEVPQGLAAASVDPHQVLSQEQLLVYLLSEVFASRL